MRSVYHDRVVIEGLKSDCGIDDEPFGAAYAEIWVDESDSHMF
jgi:hypothetical protein